MKRSGIVLILIIILCLLTVGALANSWGLTGPLLDYVMGIKDLSDYSAITEYYSKDCRTSAAVMNSRYHNVLFVYGKDANGDYSVWRSTTAVWQPGEMDDMPPVVTCTDESVTLKTDKFGTFVFNWDKYEKNFLLTYAEYGSFNLSLRNGVYYSESGKIWQVQPIDIQTFNVSLFPRTEYDMLKMNRVYAAVSGASGFGHRNVTSADGKKMPVYSAPDESSYRAAKGKATVNTAENFFLIASLYDWDLVEYDVSYRTHRTGWIHNASLSKEAPVMITDVPVVSVEYLTDDPYWSQYQAFSSSELRKIHLLAPVNPFYAYASAETADGQAVWGFVPVGNCTLPDETVDEQTMAELCGAWVFRSGGDLAAEVMLLHADGSCELGGLKNEATFEQLNLSQGFQKKDYVISSEAVWYVTDHPAQNGFEKTFVIKENGKITNLDLYGRPKVGEDGRQALILVCGEAGGTYVKVAEEEKPLAVSTVELTYTDSEQESRTYGFGYEKLEDRWKPFFPEETWSQARFLIDSEWESKAAYNAEHNLGIYKHYPIITVMDGNVQAHLFNVDGDDISRIAETAADSGLKETDGNKATAPIYHLTDAIGELDGIHRYRETLNLYFNGASDPWNTQIVLETEENNDPDILRVTHVVYQYSEPKTTLIRGQKYDYVVVTPTEKGMEYSYGYCEEPISDSFLFPFSGSTKLTEFSFSSFTDDPDKLLTAAKIDTKKHGSGGKVKLRQTPDKKGKVITEIPNAAVINCTDIGNGWCFVHYRHFCGYIMAQYIEGTDAYSQK